MILWTASPQDRIIQAAAPPPIAPMKTNSLRLMVFETRWRRVVLMFAFLSLICAAVTSRSAQSRNPRRVTALQVGATAEGSRVTIVSDSALNDYEAFRRGDRFYVRIPLADFTAAPPSFRSHGFEDVRVQEVGADVIVSFKLQPGASARVDQHSNRLEVVFSALGSLRTATASNVYPTTRSRRNTGSPDGIAGPMPPSSPPGAISRYSDSISNAQALRGTGPTRRSGTETGADPNIRSNSTAANLAPKAKPSPAPPASTPDAAGQVSPVSTPTPFSTPTVFATPNVPQPFSAPVSASPSSRGASDWESRIKFLKAWAKLNQSALIVGGLIALALLIAIALWSRLKGRRTATGEASKKTPAKPISEKGSATHGHREVDQEREVFEL